MSDIGESLFCLVGDAITTDTDVFVVPLTGSVVGLSSSKSTDKCLLDLGGEVQSINKPLSDCLAAVDLELTQSVSEREASFAFASTGVVFFPLSFVVLLVTPFVFEETLSFDKSTVQGFVFLDIPFGVVCAKTLPLAVFLTFGESVISITELLLVILFGVFLFFDSEVGVFLTAALVSGVLVGVFLVVDFGPSGVEADFCLAVGGNGDLVGVLAEAASLLGLFIFMKASRVFFCTGVLEVFDFLAEL